VRLLQGWGSSEEGDEHEPKPEPSSIKVHTAFRTVQATCAHCRLACLSPLNGMLAQMFHAC
jgi:hypothetical protein